MFFFKRIHNEMNQFLWLFFVMRQLENVCGGERRWLVVASYESFETTFVS